MRIYNDAIELTDSADLLILRAIPARIEIVPDEPNRSQSQDQLGWCLVVSARSNPHRYSEVEVNLDFGITISVARSGGELLQLMFFPGTN